MTRPVLLILVATLVLAGSWLLGGQDVTLQSLRGHLAAVAEYQQQRPVLVAALFAAAYVAITALSLPIAVWLTLAGGALFGFWTGLAIVSFASAIGATLAFLAARYLLRDWVRARFRARPDGSRPGLGTGRGVLSVFAAADPGDAVLCHEPADGSDADPDPDVLLGQPAWHAGGHRGLCERGHAAGRTGQPVRDRVAAPVGVLRGAGRVSVDRPRHRGHPSPPSRLCRMDAARDDSTGIWSSSARDRRGWSRPTSPRRPRPR